MSGLLLGIIIIIIIIIMHTEVVKSASFYITVLQNFYI